MQRNYLIAAAVAGVLSSAAASATTYDVYASGASAQRTFWQKELGASYCAGTGSVTVYAYKDPSLTVNQPDFNVATCTATATTQSTAVGLVAGDTVNLHYAADLGSVWGIWGAIPANHLATRSQMVILATTAGGGCTLVTSSGFPTSQYNCAPTAAGSFSRSADSGGSPWLVQNKSDLLLSDVEPALFAFAENWPSFSVGSTNHGITFGAGTSADNSVVKLGSVPTAGTLTTTGMGALNGEVFSIVGHGIPGTPTGLSKQSVRTLLSGGYGTWLQVPEVGAADTFAGGTPVVICRRDHGSGSEIAASIFFEGIECGQAGANRIEDAADFGLTTATNVVENASSGDLKSCLAASTGGSTGGAIGMLSLGTSGAYTTFYIDGIQANAHNAALGAYPFYTETFGVDNSANVEVAGSVQLKLSGALFTAAGSVTTLAADGFTEASAYTNGVSTTAGAQQVVFAIPASGGSSTVAASKAATPTEIQSRSGNTCSFTYNANTT
jgi:hypothetical protein